MAYNIEANRRYNEKHKAERKAYARKYGLRVRGTEKYQNYHREYMKKWHAKNREHHNQQLREDYYKRKELWHIRSRTRTFKKEIMEFFNSKCCECGATENLEIHHEKYLPKEYFWKKNFWIHREEIMSTLKVLCKECHEKKHNIILIQYAITEGRKNTEKAKTRPE